MKNLATIFIAMLVFTTSCLQPHNTLHDCREQCKDDEKATACYNFCDCIHKQGESLDKCLTDYKKVPDDTVRTP